MAGRNAGTKELESAARWAWVEAGDGKDIVTFDRYVQLAVFVNTAIYTWRLLSLAEVGWRHFALFAMVPPNQFIVDRPRSSLDAARRLLTLLDAFRDVVWALHRRPHAAAVCLRMVVAKELAFNVGKLALYPEITEHHLHQFMMRIAERGKS